MQCHLHTVKRASVYIHQCWILNCIDLHTIGRRWSNARRWIVLKCDVGQHKHGSAVWWSNGELYWSVEVWWKVQELQVFSIFFSPCHQLYKCLSFKPWPGCDDKNYFDSKGSRQWKTYRDTVQNARTPPKKNLTILRIIFDHFDLKRAPLPWENVPKS